MKINQQKNGAIIGGIFTAVSFLLTFTFVVPIFSIMPGVLIESMMSSIVDNEPYSNVGKATLATLGAMLVVSLIIILIAARKIKFTNGHIVAIMISEYFIIHSLGFYVYWATSLGFRGDGQLIMGGLFSFPVSSFGFVALGALIDSFKLKPVEKDNVDQNTPLNKDPLE